MFGNLRNWWQTKLSLIYPHSLWVFFSIVVFVTVCNLPWNTYIIGGDNEAWIVQPNFNPMDWMDTWRSVVGYGVSDARAGSIEIPLLYFLQGLKILLGSHVAYILYVAVLIAGVPLSFFYFLKSINSERWMRLIVTLFYWFSLFTWQLLHRQLDGITLGIYIGLPLLLRLLWEVFRGEKPKYLWLFVSIYLTSLSFTNPGFGIPVVVFICVWLFYCKQVTSDSKQEIWLKLAPPLFFLVILAGYVTIAWGIFLTHTTINNNDSWNRGLLTLSSLESQKTTSRPIFVTRGYNQDTGYLDGTMNGQPYSMYESNNLSNPLFELLTFVPLFLVILLVFTYSKDKRIRFWVIILFVSLGFIKSSSPPFGQLFNWAIIHFPSLGIFRSPHQKFNVWYVYALCILITLYFSLTKPSNIRTVTIGGFVGLILASSVLYVQGGLFPRSMKVESSNLPPAYNQVTKYIKENKIISLLPLPYNNKTWIETDFGYEGYPLIRNWNPDIHWYNYEDVGLNTANENLDILSQQATKQETTNLITGLKENRISGVLYDEYVNRTDRRGIVEFHSQSLSWLRSIPDLQEISFDKLHLFLQKNLPIRIESSGVIINNVPSFITVTNLPKNTQVTIRQNDAYAVGWKICKGGKEISHVSLNGTAQNWEILTDNSGTVELCFKNTILLQKAAIASIAMSMVAVVGIPLVKKHEKSKKQ